MAHNRTFRTEFPDFDFDLPVVEGWIDDSWKNDTMPSMWNEKKKLKAWFDYQDELKREVSDGSMPQFAITVEGDNGGHAMFETENLDMMIAAMSQLK